MFSRKAGGGLFHTAGPLYVRLSWHLSAFERTLKRVISYNNVCRLYSLYRERDWEESEVGAGRRRENDGGSVLWREFVDVLWSLTWRRRRLQYQWRHHLRLWRFLVLFFYSLTLIFKPVFEIEKKINSRRVEAPLLCLFSFFIWASWVARQTFACGGTKSCNEVYLLLPPICFAFSAI